MKTCLVQYADIYWDMGRYPSAQDTPMTLCVVQGYAMHLLIAFGATKLCHWPLYNLVAAEFPEELDTTKLVQIKVILHPSVNPREPKQLILNCLDSAKPFPELARELEGMCFNTFSERDRKDSKDLLRVWLDVRL